MALFDLSSNTNTRIHIFLHGPIFHNKRKVTVGSMDTGEGGEEEVDTPEGYEYVVVGSSAGARWPPISPVKATRLFLKLEMIRAPISTRKFRASIFNTQRMRKCGNYSVKHYADETLTVKDPKVTQETLTGASLFVGLNSPRE
jgi:hypothetical protein